MKKQNSPTTYRICGHVMHILAVLTLILLGIPFLMTTIIIGLIIGVISVFMWRLGTTYLKMSVVPSNDEPLSQSDTIFHLETETNKNEDYITENHFVAGTSYHRDEILELATENVDYDLSKKEIEEEYYGDKRIYQYNFYPDKVELIPEPTNEYDSNAIKVIVDGQHIGYIKKGSCNHIHNLINEDRIIDIDCNIYGGDYKELIFDDYSDKSKLVRREREFGAKVILHIKKEA